VDTRIEIAKALKAAREAKGLSQRALAKIAGVPQSHISKIENGGVDLRVSSLTEIARALDLELTLVPRKAVPAVASIVRGARPAATRQSTSMVKALRKLESAADKIASQQKAMKEAAQLQSRIHDLTRFKMPTSYLEKIEQLNRQLDKVYKQPENLKRLLDSLGSAQALRNELAHSPPEPLRQLKRPAYSLENEDDG
jgi:transcriptional regulator with XRE-family HTH domain